MLTLAALLTVSALTFLSGRGDDAYRIGFVLPNASGLRSGSDVKIGGARVGAVDSLEVTHDEVVRVGLRLDRQKVKSAGGLRSDTRFAVSTANLLGAKFVALEPGRGTAPLRPGTTLPASAGTVSTDLDQVVDVLDADTRTRLAIVINELGIGLGNRRADFSATLAQIPPSFGAVRRLLDGLVADNHTLGDAVVRSSRFVARIDRSRADLGRTVAAASDTMRIVGNRRRELAATLRDSPSTMRSLNRFLDELNALTPALGRAARTVSAAAPALDGTLTELEPFSDSASPALRSATKAAPVLDELAERGGPVVREARPTVQAIAGLSSAARPLTKIFNPTIDDLLGLMEGWSRSIQLRDGIGHYFRADAVVSRDLLDSFVSQLSPVRKQRRKKAPTKQPTSLLPSPALPSVRTPDVRPGPKETPAGKALDTLDGIVDRALPKTSPLLDFLLGS